jgi:hypothetical protein
MGVAVNTPVRPATLGLRRGDLVEVRSVEEILSTLDDRARYEALPFMPEMVSFAGRRFRVAARADRTCDRVERRGNRTMTGTVHLEGVRCDGAHHGGCEAMCLIYWKEAWLKPVDPRRCVQDPDLTGEDWRANPIAQKVFDHTRKGRQEESGELRYSCQATEQLDYTSAQEPRARHSYWIDVRCGNVPWHQAARTWIIERFNAFQQQRGGTQYPPVEGSGTRTPSGELHLRPGDLVQVRKREEIFRTLDAGGRNRGLSFDREMLPYCGGSYRVLKRVTKIIDEPSGRMMSMKRDCLILDGVVCRSRYHGLCQRAIYPYWREIWLRPASRPTRATGEGSFVAFVLGNALRMVVRRILGRRPPAQVAESS